MCPYPPKAFAVPLFPSALWLAALGDAIEFPARVAVRPKRHPGARQCDQRRVHPCGRASVRYQRRRQRARWRRSESDLCLRQHGKPAHPPRGALPVASDDTVSLPHRHATRHQRAHLVGTVLSRTGVAVLGRLRGHRAGDPASQRRRWHADRRRDGRRLRGRARCECLGPAGIERALRERSADSQQRLCPFSAAARHCPSPRTARTGFRRLLTGPRYSAWARRESRAWSPAAGVWKPDRSLRCAVGVRRSRRQRQRRAARGEHRLPIGWIGAVTAH